MRLHRRFIVFTAALAIAALTLINAEPSTGAGPGFAAIVTMPNSDKGSEPSLAVDGHGNRYASWQSPGELASSKDGQSFTYLGMPETGGAGDVTTAADAFGSVFEGQFCPPPTSLHNCIYRSKDKGKTWPQKADFADKHPGAADRPWIDVWPHHLEPYPGGAPAASAPANSDGTIVYLEYHTFSPEEFTYVTVSRDGGKTFSVPNLLSKDTNAIVGSLCNTVPGGVATDDKTGYAYALWLSPEDVSVSANGCNYSQIGPFNKAWISVSKDQGATWTSHLAWHGAFDVASRKGDNASKIFASLTVDRDSQIHVVMGVRKMDDPTGLAATCLTTGCVEEPAPTPLMIVSSPDAGEHWTAPFEFNPSGGSNFFPWPAGGTGGIVDIAYYRSPTLKPNDTSSVWHAGFSQVTGLHATLNGDTASYAGTPSVVNSLMNPNPIHRGGICTYGTFCAAVPDANRNLADSLAIALDPAGGANVVWTSDTPKNHIEFSCQSSGRSAFAGKPDLTGCFTETAAAAPSVAKKAVKKPKVLGIKKALPATGVGDATPMGLALALSASGAAIWLRRRERVL